VLRPQRSNQLPKRESALDYEIGQERAAAFGRLGRALEAALAALALHDQSSAQTDAAALSPPGQAGDAPWYFLVQSESCSVYDQRLIIRHYGVPVEVHRAGVMPCPPRRRRA
jgi:hypothetical protein